MLLKPEHRALRTLLWVVAVVVPGGFLLLALLGADAIHRRRRRFGLVPTDGAAPSEREPAPRARVATGERRVLAQTPSIDPIPRAAA